MSFNNEKEIEESEKYLTSIIAGHWEDNLRNAKLRCGDIGNLWSGTDPFAIDMGGHKIGLHEWFQTLNRRGKIDDNELLEIEQLLDNFSTSDNRVVASIEYCNIYAMNKAKKILSLLKNERIND